MKIIGSRPAIAISGVVAVLVYLLLLFLDINVIHWLDKLEPYNVDELLIPFVIVLLGIIIELQVRHYRRRLELQAERLRILKATMHTVQDIVNNFLTNMQFFQMEAEHSLPPDVNKRMDELIHETANKLKLLGDIDLIREKEVAGQSVIDFEQSVKAPLKSAKSNTKN